MIVSVLVFCWWLVACYWASSIFCISSFLAFSVPLLFTVCLACYLADGLDFLAFCSWLVWWTVFCLYCCSPLGIGWIWSCWIDFAGDYWFFVLFGTFGSICYWVCFLEVGFAAVVFWFLGVCCFSNVGFWFFPVVLPLFGSLFWTYDLQLWCWAGLSGITYLVLFLCWIVVAFCFAWALWLDFQLGMVFWWLFLYLCSCSLSGCLLVCLSVGISFVLTLMVQFWLYFLVPGLLAFCLFCHMVSNIILRYFAFCCYAGCIWGLFIGYIFLWLMKFWSSFSRLLFPVCLAGTFSLLFCSLIVSYYYFCMVVLIRCSSRLIVSHLGISMGTKNLLLISPP